GKLEQNIYDVPRDVFHPRLPQEVSTLPLREFTITRTEDHRLILGNDHIEAIFNLRDLSFEYACNGKIVAYQFPFVISYLSSGEFNVFDLQTRAVKFSFSYPN